MTDDLRDYAIDVYPDEPQHTDPDAILDAAHGALERFRGYLAGIGDEARREAVRADVFEPLSRAVALLQLIQMPLDPGEIHEVRPIRPPQPAVQRVGQERPWPVAQDHPVRPHTLPR